MAVNALHSASTGLSALSTALDVIANNLANVNTDGFKASRANFQDLLYSEMAQPGIENANGDQRPTGLYVGLGTKVSGTQIDFAQGPAIPTGNELDLYIEGEGFLQVEVDDEFGDGFAYTRAGNLVTNSDGELVLANDQGRRITPPIVIPADARLVTVNLYGLVTADIPGSDPVEIGTLNLATFQNPAGMRQIGENLFVATVASGDATLGDPRSDGRGSIRQGFLEGSNVDAATELVRLIKTQRAFELNSQSIQAADEALRTLGNLRRF
ncbi:MAG: flagellar basal-body rod protein FlgG [Phycisphaerales bacterium]|nr:flagellar basal-body rod protein FlgG [Phycisphaerales bacterium]